MISQFRSPNKEWCEEIDNRLLPDTLHDFEAEILQIFAQDSPSPQVWY